MQHTWRWFGPTDPITLAEVRQTGATGIVTALHHIPNGAVWPVEEIRARQAEIEAAGLVWAVVESVPVHEDIKTGGPRAAEAIEAYQQTLRNLAACGLDVVCYNFMPVLDWTRTDLAYPMPDGALALRFDATALAAFDLFDLARPGAAGDWTGVQTEAAARLWDGLSADERGRLRATILAGLPGAEEHYGLEEFRAALATYDDVPADRLRENLAGFLRAVIPVAEQVGVRMAIHPDDPPRPMFGLPRVVSTADDAAEVLEAAPSEVNGLTMCVGSYGSRADNDVVEMTRRFASRIHFAHLRSVSLDPDGASFTEAPHLDGDADMVAVITALVEEEARRGAAIPMRPDHGHVLLDDAARVTNPGYSLYGRMRGLAELRGVERAVRGLRGV
ncbi:mannonate dehydratase [Cellulomonas triticagri]|uniref:Mannonate dehydratase n=1 Tax=Cellulomonas triticagri TaxID=2483352 RepID=A0A3M2IY22_9CELL|nr:mannonate dehydratase [Cellulomonas triticagri]RMI03715.1 mannonate dehydratase [Cellulomonas triticagri]